MAWLQCQSFDSCKTYSNGEGIYIDNNYWGIQGWEVTTASGSNGFCFGAAPNFSRQTTVHHIIFANNVANGCQAGGFVTFNVGAYAGADYVSIIGNAVYNAIQGGQECYNGISIFQPVASDSNSGTHIYIAGNFSWNNFQPYSCGGVQAWGGDGLIIDTPDGSSGLSQPYTAQILAENNILVGNGGHGLEVQNNVAGSQHAPIYLRNNTSSNNELDANQQQNHLCAEILLNSAYNVQEAYNLASTRGATACANDPIYALSAYTINGTVWAYNNFAYGANGQNNYFYNGGSFQYASNNTFGQNPYFASTSIPGAPSCSGTASVPACMSKMVYNFTPTNNVAKGFGYQTPGGPSMDKALFPQWLCSVNLPAGLIINGC